MNRGDLEDDIDHDVLVDELSTPPTQEEAADLAWKDKRFERLIEGLTQKEREVLRMRFKEDHSFVERFLQKEENRLAIKKRTREIIKRVKKRLRSK